MLTPKEKDLLKRHVSIDGDGNVVGNDNTVYVTKQEAGDYAVQIGEQRVKFTIEELRHVLRIEDSQVGGVGDGWHVEGGIHFHRIGPSHPMGDTTPPFASEQLVSPKRSSCRCTIAIVIILAVVASLILTLLTQPYRSSDPGDTALPIGPLPWIVQISVSFIAILASVLQLAGMDVRELFIARPAGASVEAFPFHVIRDFDELLDYLFPDPTAPLLPDRSIRFLPRIADELDAAFSQRKHILVRGRSKTGKTREVVELLRRWWYTGPTVLLVKNHVGLYPPYKVPATLPVHNLVLLFDDVDRYCGDHDAVKRLDQTIDFFANLCHDPQELRVIATARQEPEFWNKLHYDESDPSWNEFELVSLPPLPPDGAQRLIDRLAQDCDIAVAPSVAEELATKNDGTFLNLVLSFRGWMHEGLKQVGPEQTAAFEGNLIATWRLRYERLVELLPEAGPIYAAVDLLRKLDIPLRPPLIAELATEMNMSRAYHLLQGLFHWVIWHKLYLSPRLDWYRNLHRRRFGPAIEAVTTSLMFYTFLFLFLSVTPASFQISLSRAVEEQLWLLLLIFSPLLFLLALLLILWLYRHLQQRRVQATLDRLLEIEIPLRGDDLRPYEGQFEGKGASQAYSPAFFSGKDGTTTLSRLVYSRLAAVYCTWAKRLRDAEELEPARSLAMIARSLAPDHPLPPFVLGTLWYAEGDFVHALVEFGRSCTLNPTAGNALALERSAWCFYQLEEFEQAEIAAEQALALIPTLLAARWARGLARLQQGHIEPELVDCRREALAKEAQQPDLTDDLSSALATARCQNWANEVDGFLERDKSARKKRTALWNHLCWGLVVGLYLICFGGFLPSVPYVSRNLEKNASLVLRIIDISLAFYPRASLILHNRGLAYHHLGDYERAIADYTEVICLDPEYAYAYYNRGLAYRKLGDYENAIADCTEAIYLDPEYAYAYYNRGFAYHHLGDYERAIADYTEVICLDPEYAYAYYNRGLAYRKLGDYENAIADCTEAIYLDPEYAYAYYNRGFAYRKLGDYENAIADYTEAIRLEPDDADTYYSRGLAYYYLQDYGEAIADYTEAIYLDPEYAYAYYNRGLAYRKLGDYENAIADYTEAIRLEPDDADTYYSRGLAYYYLQDYGEAIADYTEAIRLDPEAPWTHYYGACIHAQLGHVEDACVWLEKATALDAQYRDYARTDEDFDLVRNAPCFQALMQEE